MSLALVSGSAMAQDAPAAGSAVILPNVVFSKASPNGKYLINENAFGPFQVYNVETGQFGPEYMTEDGEPYSGGLGTAISNDGVALACTDPYELDASYLENGEWKLLPLPEGASTTGNIANCITPDGKYICGSLDGVYDVPCVWTRNADGTYGQPEVLPHPDKDFAGLTPQYVLANYISNDGTIVCGQMTDNSGFMHMPVVFRKDAEGNWSYEILGYKDLFHADELDLPEFPGDEEPEGRPEVEDYMDADKRAEYEAALAEWKQTYEGDYPNAADYMTEEQIAKYNADSDAYNELLLAWEEKYYAWLDAYQMYCVSAPYLEMNAYHCSPNGRYYAATQVTYIESDFSWFPIPVPNTLLFDTTTGEYRTIGVDQAIMVNQVTDEGMILGSTPMDDYTRQAYICLPGADKYITLEEYYKVGSPELSTWITENLTFTLPTYTEDENGNLIEGTEKKILTGTPCASHDFSLIAGWLFNIWDETDLNYFYSIIYKAGKTDGVEGIEADTAIDGEATYYNLQGIKVANPENGIFIKVQGNKTSKVVL